MQLYYLSDCLSLSTLSYSSGFSVWLEILFGFDHRELLFGSPFYTLWGFISRCSASWSFIGACQWEFSYDIEVQKYFGLHKNIGHHQAFAVLQIHWAQMGPKQFFFSRRIPCFVFGLVWVITWRGENGRKKNTKEEYPYLIRK